MSLETIVAIGIGVLIIVIFVVADIKYKKDINRILPRRRKWGNLAICSNCFRDWCIIPRKGFLWFCNREGCSYCGYFHTFVYIRCRYNYKERVYECFDKKMSIKKLKNNEEIKKFIKDEGKKED